MPRRTTRRRFLKAGLAAAAVGGAGYALWPDMGPYRAEADRLRRPLATEPDLHDLVRFATLAPNGHNTQPWQFRLQEARVTILPDPSRRTPVVDPDDHHLCISLGCAGETLALAAAARGRPADLRVEDGASPSVDLALGRGPATESPLFAAIPLRQSTRSDYDGQPVAPADLALMERAARQDGVSLALFTAPADREAILDYVIAGNDAQMDDPAFVAELRGWIRFGPDRALATADGLFSACSGNPALPERLGQLAFGAVFTKEREADRYAGQLRSSAGIAVFTADRTDHAHWVAVGQSFQRFALQATALGIRTAHVNQPVEVPAVREDFARWLGAPGARPDLVVRFGRAPAMPMSLRRPVEAVLA
jgi:hypothetical protein